MCTRKLNSSKLNGLREATNRTGDEKKDKDEEKDLGERDLIGQWNLLGF